jgi:hypothetical protein
MDFKIVPDTRRRAAKRGKATSSLMWDAVRAGQTVLVSGMAERNLSGQRTMLARQGFRLHVMTDPDGVLVWAEKIDQTGPA